MATTYLYLEPTNKTKSTLTGIVFILLITVMAMYYVHIYINWTTQTIQCRLDNLYLAYFTGNISEWWTKCAKTQ